LTGNAAKKTKQKLEAVVVVVPSIDLDAFFTRSLDFSGPHAKTLVELLGHESLLLHGLDANSLSRGG
jgi:uncharacterized membrane protein YqhA